MILPEKNSYPFFKLRLLLERLNQPKLEFDRTLGSVRCHLPQDLDIFRKYEANPDSGK